jgi:hypothetical protein
MGVILWPLGNAFCALLVINIRLIVCTTDLSGLEGHAVVFPFHSQNGSGHDRDCLRTDMVRRDPGWPDGVGHCRIPIASMCLPDP